MSHLKLEMCAARRDKQIASDASVSCAEKELPEDTLLLNSLAISLLIARRAASMPQDPGATTTATMLVKKLGQASILCA